MAEWLDPKWVALWMKVTEWLVVIVFAIYSWVNTRTKASQKAVETLVEMHREDMARMNEELRRQRRDIEERIDLRERQMTAHLASMRNDMAERVDTVETDLNALSGQVQRLPDKADIVRIHKRIDALAEASAATSSAVKEMGKTLQIIHMGLMEGK